ncbi:electron transport complex subunit RsxC, partial [Pasteurella bettyae]
SQTAVQNTEISAATESTEMDPKKAAIAAAITRAKAKKQAAQGASEQSEVSQTAVQNTEISTATESTEMDPKKAAIAAAIARAKAKKQAAR